MTTTPAPSPEMPPPAERSETLAKFRSARKRRVKTMLLIVTALVAVGVVWFGMSAVAAFQKISSKSETASPFLKFFGATVDPNALRGEGDGRVNVLFIGVGGAGHKGGTLADTVMVASIDPENKQLALLSLPRDLRVPIAGNGQGKINSAHSYGESQEAGRGPVVLKETVSQVLDLPIHYYIRADFQGFVKLVDAVGGVTIDVPKALNDPFYPDAELIGYEPFSIGAGVQKLTGKVALKYARSRQTTSDFDRASRQQQILIGFREKALSLQVLANPAKIQEILGIVGNHIRMDLSATELKRLFDLASGIEADAISTVVLDNSADGPLQTINEGGYYLVPKTGNFKEVQRIAHELFTDPYITKEAAALGILNGSGVPGEAKELQLDLESLGYNVASIDTTDQTVSTVLYDYSGGTAPFTVKFLADRLDVPVRVATPSPGTTVDLELVLGTDFKLPASLQ